jgi:hypothetical protein
MTAKATYLFRGAIRCVTCSRKMEGAKRRHAVFYRCAARTLVPGSPAAHDHPPTVYLREDQLAAKINEWVAGCSARKTLTKLLQFWPVRKTSWETSSAC